MNRVHFVYCPQSGPQWLGEAEPRDCSDHDIPMAVCRGAKERLPFRPQLPDHVLDSRRYQGSRETRS